MDREILLEKYLMNELSDEEAKQLKKIIETDEAFKEEVEIRSVLYADYKTDIKKELIKNLATTKAAIPQLPEQSTSSTKIYKLLRPVLSIAAILAIGIMGLWFFQNNQPNISQLAMESLKEQPPGITVLMDENTNTDANWNAAVEAYQKKEYKIAATLLEQSVTKTSKHNFYLGLSYLHQQPIIAEKAIEYLKKVVETNSQFTEEANWYLSLAYAINNNAAEAQKYLEQIPNESGYYAKAQKMLESINQ